ncbi:MAG: carbamoyltransferase HypF, partial [Myxococcota bacterium]
SPQSFRVGPGHLRHRCIGGWFLMHDRPIETRIDDALARVHRGQTRMLRLARGYAPLWIPLPPGLPQPEGVVLAMGAQWKGSFCLVRKGRVMLSPHVGDLDDFRTAEEFDALLERLLRWHQLEPEVVVMDQHPEYRSSIRGRALAEEAEAEQVFVQHHHAHIASCLGDNGWPADGPPVLGVALDGLGLGPEGEIWGGEFLLANYAGAERYASLKPVAMIGGDKASREPWRNLYAHLRAELSWAELDAHFGDLEAVAGLRRRPVDAIESMLHSGTGAPLASSAGRLFDAAATALGLFADGVSYEAQAAMALEALVDDASLAEARGGDHYPIAVPNLPNVRPYVEPLGMWRAILGDLAAGTDPRLIAARFHVAVADAVVAVAEKARREERFEGTVALSGGVFLNRVLVDLVVGGLEEAGFEVLLHARLPPHDGGLAFGQALVALAALRDG